MEMAYVVLATLVGWCGTPWRRWPFPNGPRPGGPTPPDPRPWCPMCGKLIGMLGGALGGFGVIKFFSGEVSVITVTIGAVVGSVILGDIYDVLKTSQRLDSSPDPIPAKK